MNKIRTIFALLIVTIVLLFVINAKSCAKQGEKAKSGSSNSNEFIINSPSNLNANVISVSQINLSWQDNSNNEDGFEIQRKSWSNGVWTPLNTLDINTSSYSDNEIILGTIYYYRVRAFNTIGDYSAYSNEVAITALNLIWSNIAVGGGNHTIAQTNDGRIWGWGLNANGQVGVGDTEDRFAPAPIGTGTDWQIINASYYNSYAIKTDGTLWSWGPNGTGQLGMGDTQYENWEPFPIDMNTDWVSIIGGAGYAIGWKSNGTLWGWGRNDYGQLALGYFGASFFPDRVTPAQIGSATDWSAFNGINQSQGAFINHAFSMKNNPAGGGTLWIWGANNIGQLGLGDGIDRNTPVLLGTNSEWTIVTAGRIHSIGLKNNGTLWSCGYNWYGELGLGDITSRSTPSQIGMDSDWSAIGAGLEHSLAIKTNRTAWAWGYNTSGQLGVGDYIQRNTPAQIGISSDWASIGGGNNHTIALKTNGTIWAWGDNTYGQLGYGEWTNRNQPVQTGFPSPDQPISLTAVLISLSQINLYWIDRSYNEEGFKIERKYGTDGTWNQIAAVELNTTGYEDTVAPSTTPYYYRVRAYNPSGNSAYSNMVSLATVVINVPSNLAIISASSLQINLAWIDNADNETGFKIERKISNTGTYQEIATVNFNVNSYADISPTGFTLNTMYYYRVRSYNIYGNGDYSNEASFMLGVWAKAAAGNLHTIAIRDNGTIWSWGDNHFGQLGLADENTRNTPTQIEINSDWSKVTTGRNHTIAIRTDKNGKSTLWGWGYNEFYQLGINDTENKNRPTSIGTDSDWSAIAAGDKHTLAIKTDKTLWSWGQNDSGQLGVGDYDQRTVPVNINSDSDWSKITAGDLHTISIKTDKTMWVWGNNEFGQLGLDDFDNRNSPVLIQEGSWSDITAGAKHSISLDTSGAIWSWGDNSYGQLGLGDTEPRRIPTRMGTDANWAKVVAGAFHTLAIRNEGTLWTWGNDESGQLGNDNGEIGIPTMIGKVENFEWPVSNDWNLVSAGGNHSLAIKIFGTLWSWGNNESGQLGLGDFSNKEMPNLVEE